VEVEGKERGDSDGSRTSPLSSWNKDDDDADLGGAVVSESSVVWPSMCEFNNANVFQDIAYLESKNMNLMKTAKLIWIDRGY
jgi:hypothetical protein